MTISFGRIGTRRIVTFKVSDDGKMLPSKFRGMEDEMRNVMDEPLWISARESFRRWKIARKAWATRRKRQGQGQGQLRFL